MSSRTDARTAFITILIPSSISGAMEGTAPASVFVQRQFICRAFIKGQVHSFSNQARVPVCNYSFSLCLNADR